MAIVRGFSRSCRKSEGKFYDGLVSRCIADHEDNAHRLAPSVDLCYIQSETDRDKKEMMPLHPSYRLDLA